MKKKGKDLGFFLYSQTKIAFILKTLRFNIFKYNSQAHGDKISRDKEADIFLNVIQAQHLANRDTPGGHSDIFSQKYQVGRD